MMGWGTWLDTSMELLLGSEMPSWELLGAIGLSGSVDALVPLFEDVLTVGEAVDYARVLCDLGRLDAAREVTMAALGSALGMATLAPVHWFTRVLK